MELDLTGIPRENLNDVKDQVGQLIVEGILKTVGGAKSPVQGENFPKLSKDYKAFKLAHHGSGVPDLELTGDMLDSLTFKRTKDGVEVGFFNDEAWKADGHNKFSGKENNTPKRRFLPAKGQEFISSIQGEAERIILDARTSSETFSSEELSDIDTKTDLYSYLGEKMGIDTRPDIKMAVLRNQELTNLLDKHDLLDLL